LYAKSLVKTSEGVATVPSGFSTGGGVAASEPPPGDRCREPERPIRCAVIGLAWLAFQVTGSTTPAGPILDRLQQAVTRPLPAAPAPVVPRPDQVWVPDRYVVGPHGSRLHVPAHWERSLSTGEAFVPPLVACSATGECVLVPAGRRPPADVRLGP
jgi:hypothetical protein